MINRLIYNLNRPTD